MTKSRVLAALSAAVVLGAAMTGAHAGSAFAQSRPQQAQGSPSALRFNYTLVASPHDPTFTQLLGINDSDVISGYDGSGQTVNGTLHPFNGLTLRLPHSFTFENFTNEPQTQVVAINNHGETGGFYIDAAGANHGFFNVGGHFSTIDLPGTTFNQILGVNNEGQAAGYFQDAQGVNHAYVRETNGSFLVLPGDKLPNSQATGINDLGTIVGFTQPTGTTSSGFIMQGDSIVKLNYPGSTFTQALGENDLGQVVGTYNDAQGTAHGFLYQNGRFATLDVPGAMSTVINGINNHDQIVGFITDVANNTVGVVGSLTLNLTPQLHAQLLGKNEVPGPGDTNGGGTALVTLDPLQNQVCYSIAVAGLTGTVMKAHIHMGAAGASGPVVVEFAPPTQGSSSGCVTVMSSVITSIQQNPANFYVNVHTSTFAEGAARGQLSK